MAERRTLTDLDVLAGDTLIEGLSIPIRRCLERLHARGLSQRAIHTLIEGLIRCAGQGPRTSILLTACDYYVDRLQLPGSRRPVDGPPQPAAGPD